MATADNNSGALVPSTERPTFTPEDLALVNPGSGDADDGALETARRAVESGAFTVAEAARQWKLTRAEEEALSKPRPRAQSASALQAIEAELAEIAKYRRENKIRYFRDEATLAREQELLAKQARLKSLPASARDAAAEDVLPDALQQRWGRQPGGVDAALGAIRRRLTLAWDGADPADIDDLKAAFDGDLSEDIQTEIALALAEDGGRWPKASEQAVKDFRGTEHGAALLDKWGAAGAALLGAARSEADFISSSLTEGSRLRLHRWAESRSPSQKAAIISALAARAAKRTAIQASGR